MQRCIFALLETIISKLASALPLLSYSFYVRGFHFGQLLHFVEETMSPSLTPSTMMGTNVRDQLGAARSMSSVHFPRAVQNLASLSI
jgi:hypothetical protein